MERLAIHRIIISCLMGCFLLTTTSVFGANNNLALGSKKSVSTESSTNSQNVENPVKTANINPLGHTEQKTYTLLQMSGTDGFILRGASAIKIFFLPILHEWDLDSVSLHFSIYRAALSNKATTLTLLVNDNPVSSLELTGRVNDKIPWDVTIPLSLLKGNAVNIRINSAVSDYGYDCYNLSNPNYWVYITGDSTVTYNYKPIAYVPNLSKFPYPFIKDPSLEKDYVAIVFPTQISLDNLTAAFYLTNALGHRETWRGIKLKSTTVDRLTDDVKKEANIIYMGTAKELQLDKMGIKWPLPVNANDEILDKDNKVINNETGVILLAVSPWNPIHAVLVVTGNSDAAVNNAALMLRDPNFASSVLFSGYAFVPQTPEIKLSESEWTTTTFKNLGYENQVIYGNGENTLNYSINLPNNKITKKLILSLDYSVSPFLSTSQNSTVTLKVNDMPVSGKSIDTVNTSIAHWKYSIDGSNLRPGTNIISLSFNLKLKNVKCTPQDASLSWITVYSTSSLDAIYNDERPLLSMIKFPALLNNEVVVAVPQSNEYFSSESFLQSILELAEKLNKVTYVKFIQAKLVKNNDVADANVLFFDNAEEDSLFNKYKSSYPFSFKNQKISINSKILPFLSISDETPASIVQLIPSPFNADKVMLMVSGLNGDGFRLGLDLLNEPKKTNLVNGNVALIYKNGTFTSVQSQRLEQNAKNKKTINTISNNVFRVFMGLIILIVILLIVKYIRKKWINYYGKK